MLHCRPRRRAPGASTAPSRRSRTRSGAARALLAGGLTAAVLLGSATPAAAAPEPPPNPSDTQLGEAQSAQDAAAAEGLACSSAMREGDPADVIVSLAARHNADLLVVGNVGMNRRLLGSVPNTVTHKARCSVLLVKTT